MAAAAGLGAGSWDGVHSLPKRTRARRLAAVGLNVGAAWLASVTRAPHTNRDERFDAIRRMSANLMRSLNITVVRKGAMVPRSQAALMIANHVSWLDICTIGSVDGALFVAKSDLARWPVMGAIAKHHGNFFHARGNIRDAARVKDRVAQALRDGWRVAVFPEGTTSTGTALMPFYPALAQAAVDAGAVVQTVAIRYLDTFGALNLAVPFIGDQTFVNSLGKILGQQEIIAEITFGDPVSARGATRRELMAEAHRLIADTLGIRACHTAADPAALRRGLSSGAAVASSSPLRDCGGRAVAATA
ncbi:MAG: lysophospholipid acyltransferase family protein [Candidatus Binataceae bacterium]|jgi:1-acyl-sn-glycerol-3-phosphate acyltransferase